MPRDGALILSDLVTRRCRSSASHAAVRQIGLRKQVPSPRSNSQICASSWTVSPLKANRFSWHSIRIMAYRDRATTERHR
jgi:hypothetical protein